MDSKKFHSFRYVVGNDFVYQDKVKVKVFFICNYKNFVTTIDIKKKFNADEAYYLNEAKKIVNQMIKEDTLMGHKKKKVNDKKKKKKIVLLTTIPAGAAAIVGITLGCYFGLKPTPETGPWYTRTDWWNYCSCGKEGIEATTDDIGKEVNVQVNGQIHKVRLIDINKDKTSDNNSIHATFEFVNLISDANGYSLATYWENTNSIESANFDYMNSTIRAVLNGNNYEGSSSADINYFQYFGLDEDFADESKGTTGKNKLFSTTYANKSILSMLPKELTDVMVAPSKLVNVYDHEKGEFTEIAVNDKLFLLSPREMGFEDDEYRGQEASTTSYKLYETHTEYMDEFRIKKQVKGSDGARTSMLYAKDLDGAYKPPRDPREPGTKSSYAGYNSAYKNTSGGTYWLRSPYYPGEEGLACTGSAWYVDDNFGLTDGFYIHAYDRAMGVAPAFCI